jgi:hypothetical protein
MSFISKILGYETKKVESESEDEKEDDNILYNLKSHY